MPVIARIEEMPEYLSSFTDHQIAMRQAGDDEVAKLQAQLAWSNKQREMEARMTQSNEADRQQQETIARIREQYRDVPEHIWSSAGDPQMMESTAKAFDEAVKAKIAAASPPPPTSPSGQPPTGLGQPANADTDLESRLRHLAPIIHRGVKDDGKTQSKSENLEFQNLMINGIIAPAMLNAKRAAIGGATR